MTPDRDWNEGRRLVKGRLYREVPIRSAEDIDDRGICTLCNLHIEHCTECISEFEVRQQRLPTFVEDGERYALVPEDDS